VVAFCYDPSPLTTLALVTMAKTTRTASSSSRDLRALLHVPQSDLSAQLASRLEQLGFPALRPAQLQVLGSIGRQTSAGVRLSDLVAELSLPKQTVGDLLDELEQLRLVERFPDPEHGVIKRVRLGPKGKVWAAEVRRVSAEAEARWATRLGTKKMKSLRALLEELAATVDGEKPATNGARVAKR
jgi:DNA-binding MarR family transcriptional regulator